MTDCVGLEGVPLEPDILGARRMSTKGCSFDAIACGLTGETEGLGQGKRCAEGGAKD